MKEDGKPLSCFLRWRFNSEEEKQTVFARFGSTSHQPQSCTMKHSMLFGIKNGNSWWLIQSIWRITPLWEKSSPSLLQTYLLTSVFKSTKWWIKPDVTTISYLLLPWSVLGVIGADPSIQEVAWTIFRHYRAIHSALRGNKFWNWYVSKIFLLLFLCLRSIVSMIQNYCKSQPMLDNWIVLYDGNDVLCPSYEKQYDIRYTHDFFNKMIHIYLHCNQITVFNCFILLLLQLLRNIMRNMIV